MPSLPFRVRALPDLILITCALLAAPAYADIVWTPQSGWTVQGGALGSLVDADSAGRNAKEIMDRATVAENSGHAGTALSLYEKVARNYPRSDFAAEALFRAGNLRLDRRQYYTSFELYQQVVSLHPDTKHFNQIIGQQYDISKALIDGAHNHMWGLIPAPFTNREQGLEYAETILTNAPRSEYAPLALMNIAVGLQHLGRTEESIDALDRMINTYPQNLLAPDAYLGLARAHASLVAGPDYDQGSTREAITYFEDFMLQFPQDPNIPAADKGLRDMKETLAQSKIIIADFYFYKRDNYAAARVFYNEAITIYPDSPTAATARTRLATVDAAEAKAKVSGPRRKFLGIF